MPSEDGGWPFFSILDLLFIVAKYCMLGIAIYYKKRSKPTKQINLSFPVFLGMAYSIYPEKNVHTKMEATFYWRSILTCSFKFVSSIINLAHTVLEYLPEVPSNILKKKRKK